MLYSYFVLIRILRGPEREPVLWEDADTVVPGVYPGCPGGGLPAGLPRLQTLHPATLLPQVRPRLPGGSEQAWQVDLDFIKNIIFPQRWLISLNWYLLNFFFRSSSPHNSSVLDSVHLVHIFAKFSSFIILLVLFSPDFFKLFSFEVSPVPDSTYLVSCCI